jgi:hypothetical protein
MLKEVTSTEAVGRTVKFIDAGSSYTKQSVIVFTDGTFTTLEVSYGHDGDAGIWPAKLDVLDYGDSSLVAAGIATHRELTDLRAANLAKDLESGKAARRRQYEALRAEFEPKQGE